MITSTQNGLFTRVFSLSGHGYLYDAVSNRFFDCLHQPGNPPFHTGVHTSPIDRIKLPFSFHELKQEIELRLSHLMLNVTEECNLRCDYCSYNGRQQYRRSHSTVQMSRTIARNSVDWFFEHSREAPEVTIGFYGGEPLIPREMVKDTVEYAKTRFSNRKIRYTITTNGLLLDADMVHWLSANPEVFVNVTLNGPRELHDRFRHTAEGHGSQSEIMKNLLAIKNSQPVVFQRQIGITLNYLTSVELPLISQWYCREPVFQGKLPVAIRRIVLRFADPELQQWFKPWLLDHHEALAVLNRIEAEYIKDLPKQRLGRHLWGLLWDGPMVQLHYRSRIPLQPVHHYDGCCYPLTKRTFVDAAGNLRLCEKGDGKMILGHVNRGIDYGKLENLISGFEELLNQSCRSCFAIRRCALCLNDVLGEQGIDARLQAPRCREFINGFQHELSLYCSVMETGEKLLDHLPKPGDRRKAPC